LPGTKKTIKMRLSILLLLLFCFLHTKISAQTDHQTSGWIMFLNNTKLSEKWGAYMDMQVRSSDNFENVRSFLFRPGITYYVNAKNEVTLGYLLNDTFTHLDGTGDNKLTEHRIWEQYVFKHKIQRVIASHRFRVEQRFIEKQGPEDAFAQRFRYFARFILPLKKGEQAFEKGAYLALQNEIFLNIQHKQKVNNHFFDQNRAYLATGYRFSKKVDAEVGYLLQAVKGVSNNTLNNVIQVAVYTKF
jgi:hypothetical protein